MAVALKSVVVATNTTSGNNVAPIFAKSKSTLRQKSIHEALKSPISERCRAIETVVLKYWIIDFHHLSATPKADLCAVGLNFVASAEMPNVLFQHLTVT